MISEMETVSFDKNLNFRTTGVAQDAIDLVLLRVKRARRATWKGRAPSKESLINASWLYLADLPDEELNRIFGEYLPKLEALMGDESDGEANGEPSAPAPPREWKPLGSKVIRDPELEPPPKKRAPKKGK